jgi:hypothetical protein
LVKLLEFLGAAGFAQLFLESANLLAQPAQAVAH